MEKQRMSDTVINRPGAKNKLGKGLKIERVFSTQGAHPYDQVTWERRDVVQTNWKTGETVFEQKGVEFPDFWSVNASTIVTTKYFRGAVGHENREWSLKQVIDRVVLTYTKAGKEHGYFATPEDAHLTHLSGLTLEQLLHNKSRPASFSRSMTLWIRSLTGIAKRA
jgi:ribonucleoside-diphosphate reductase alpha chain